MATIAPAAPESKVQVNDLADGGVQLSWPQPRRMFLRIHNFIAGLIGTGICAAGVIYFGNLAIQTGGWQALVLIAFGIFFFRGSARMAREWWHLVQRVRPETIVLRKDVLTHDYGHPLNTPFRRNVTRTFQRQEIEEVCFKTDERPWFYLQLELEPYEIGAHLSAADKKQVANVVRAWRRGKLPFQRKIKPLQTLS